MVGSEERYEFCRTAQFLNGRAITIVRVSELVYKQRSFRCFGYQSEAALCRAFKRTFDLSPGSVRRNAEKASSQPAATQDSSSQGLAGRR